MAIPGISIPRGRRLKLPKLRIEASTFRIPKHDHVPHPPFAFHLIAALALVLSIIILGLTAATISYLHYSRSIPAFALFVSIFTILTLTYRYVALLRFPTLYNRLAVLILHCLFVVWWLSAFASLAAWSAAEAWLEDPICTVDKDGTRFCIYKRDTIWHGREYRGCVAAAASLSALQFVLVLISLVMYAIAFHRLRKTGAPYLAGSKWTTTASPNLTPTGITMAQAIAEPIMTPSSFETTRAPPKIETISKLPIADLFSTPLEQMPKSDGFVPVVVAKEEIKTGEVKAKRPEIRHNGTFYIDDGVVTPTDALGGGAAKAEPKIV